MTHKIFISYRRAQSAGSAGRIKDQLEDEFGAEAIFMDVDSIPLGSRFPEVIREEVAKSQALLAVIGPDWLDARDEHGARRLDNSDDFVRVEISTALRSGARVIPILLDEAKIPRPTELPDDLKDLSNRSGFGIRHASFREDVGKLADKLKKLLDTDSSDHNALEGGETPFQGGLAGSVETLLDKVRTRSDSRRDPRKHQVLAMVSALLVLPATGAALWWWLQATGPCKTIKHSLNDKQKELAQRVATGAGTSVVTGQIDFLEFEYRNNDCRPPLQKRSGATPLFS